MNTVFDLHIKWKSSRQEIKYGAITIDGAAEIAHQADCHQL